MKTQTVKYKASELKKFHILAGKLAMSEAEKREMIRSFGVESSRDLSYSQLKEACSLLSYRINRKAQDLDLWRKRVIAAACSYIDCSNLKSITDKVEYAKGIAAKAASVDHFNDIQQHKLQLLYNTFIKKSALQAEVTQALSEAEIFLNDIKKKLNIK
ncbi:MAG: hypothetical protein AB9922_07360 [Bacteroidales bacterium]